MFVCGITGKSSKSGEKPVMVTVEKRLKEYYGYPKKSKDKKRI